MLALALLLVSPARAGLALSGDDLAIWYNEGGLWNDTTAGEGVHVRYGGAWTEVVYPGLPWQQTSIAFDENGASYAFGGNYDHHDWTVRSSIDASTSTDAIAVYEWWAGDLDVVKTESWSKTGEAVSVTYTVTNLGGYALSNLVLMFGVDWDVDHDTGNGYTTLNDTLDVDGDGVDDWVESVGPVTGYTAGIGACEPTIEDVGHTGPGSDNWATDAGAPVEDFDGVEGDDEMVWRHVVDDLNPGSTRTFGFVVAFGDTAADARALYQASIGLCDCDDADKDGYFSASCAAGDDCDDGDAAIHPGADETWYDGVDEDCDGASDFDADQDGFDATANGGDDCDDFAPNVNPLAAEVWYDGLDENCDGGDDYDQDGDGHERAINGGDDCDDEDAAAHPDATEVWYDGVDEDCSGGSDADADGDGHDDADHGGDDCDDGDATVFPGADDAAGDGVDQDCDGADATTDVGVTSGGGCGCDQGGGAGGALAFAVGGLFVRRRRVSRER